MYKLEFIDSGVGKISIDHFSETFESDLRYWSQAQYENHWDESRFRVQSGHPSFFFTSVFEPSFSNFLRAWTCYPIGNELVFQERMLFIDQLSSKMDLANPHIHIFPYSNVSEEGDEISEWRTDAEFVT